MSKASKNINKKIPICKILNVNIAAINMKWLIDYISNNISNLSKNYICVSNVHTVIMAYENAEYLGIQNGAIMAIPDGGPLSFIGRKRGFQNMGRITGPSFMEEIFKISVQKGYRHYFFGSTNDTLKKLSTSLKNKYPGICISGMYSPPFREMSEEEDLKIIKTINECKADFIWIGLGAPKQEIWMAKHKGLIDGLMIGVGAGFDYHAGNIQRAPEWMQNNNLEWMYRLIQEPRRLFYRYWYTNTRFIWHVIIRGK